MGPQTKKILENILRINHNHKGHYHTKNTEKYNMPISYFATIVLSLCYFVVIEMTSNLY